MDPQRARAEEQKWHAELAVVEMVERTGVALDTVIDYGPLPLRWQRKRLARCNHAGIACGSGISRPCFSDLRHR